MTRFVVTGGAGFIGSTLVRQLLSEPDANVLVIDNFLTGHARNLEEIRSRISFNEADIRDYAATAKAIAGAEVVFHLAAIPSVPRSIREPAPSHEVNIDGTFNVFRACAEARVRRVVYAASSSAYGDTEVLPKVETMLPRPKSPYAVQKLTGEYYASVFHECFALETVALRFFNVYGERQDPSSPYSGVLSLFMRALIERRPPTLFGDGEQTRDFTYVEDVAGLCVKASQAQGVAGKMYNAGNGNRYTLNHIWDLLQKIEGISLKPLFAPPREGDVRDSQADTTAAKRDLGHDPQFTLEQGLRRTLAWYRAQ
jgi:nucleoside-diphosphate-sugar epimerase